MFYSSLPVASGNKLNHSSILTTIYLRENLLDFLFNVKMPGMTNWGKYHAWISLRLTPFARNSYPKMSGLTGFSVMLVPKCSFRWKNYHKIQVLPKKSGSNGGVKIPLTKYALFTFLLRSFFYVHKIPWFHGLLNRN